MGRISWKDEPRAREEVAALFGDLDRNCKLIQQGLQVNMGLDSQGLIQLEGEDYDVRLAQSVLGEMAAVVRRQGFITPQEVNYLVQMANQHSDVPVNELLRDIIISTAQGKPIRAKTLGQKRYIDAVNNNGFTFGIGPAGTGKTYLAVAMAVRAFKNNEVGRIVLTRPAVEAGESLGFLPGDLQEKIDPYLRPLYDALFEILGHEQYERYKEKGLIEVAPLAYMRGRTLNNSFIILDEAQNTTLQQMKMFLTRLGYGSKAVITGDITQIDLPSGRSSGLVTIQKILRGVKGVEFCYFDSSDVIRHPLVQRVIDAFAAYDKKSQAKAARRQKRG